MSPLRRALVSLLVIAVSAGLLVVASRLQPEPPPPPGALVKPVFGVPADRVTAFDIRSWQGRIAATRVHADWHVEAFEIRAGEGISAAEPPSPEVVNAVIEELLREIVGTPEIDRFPREDQPLAAFGLDAPQATIRLRLGGGGERSLEIGGLTSTGAALYALLLPADEIVAVGNPIFNAIQAALYRLRGLAGTAIAPSL